MPRGYKLGQDKQSGIKTRTRGAGKKRRHGDPPPDTGNQPESGGDDNGKKSRQDEMADMEIGEASPAQPPTKSKNPPGGMGRSCDTCQQIGETTPVDTYPECEVALCDRCPKIHRATPTSRDHEVCNLSEKVKVAKTQKIMCREHKENCIEFHCKDCNKSACQKCCIFYHSTCKSVPDIESMRQEMATELLKKRDVFHEILDEKSWNFRRKNAAITKAIENVVRIKSQIRSVSKKAIDKIKRKEKRLMKQLDKVSDKQVCQLQADVKAEEIHVQMYKQHCAFIDQAVNSECAMDMYDMYQAHDSGILLPRDDGETDTEDMTQVVEITFTHEQDKFSLALQSLVLGVLDIKYQETGVLMGTPVLTGTTDTRTYSDKESPDVSDVTVLDVDGVQTVVVTDWENRCLKSFFTLNNKSCQSSLSLLHSPCGITQLKENKVLVSVPDINQIITVQVTPHLVQLSTVKTYKKYFGLGVITPSSLAATTGYPDSCVDILNMEGDLMKSVRWNNCRQLFSYPIFLRIIKGRIVVSDWKKKSVTCLTGKGDFVWQYTPTGRELTDPRGITSTGNGSILIADGQLKKVIQLSKKGEFVRDVVTSTDGLTKPYALFFTGRGSLFVCDDDDQVKQFSFI